MRRKVTWAALLFVPALVGGLLAAAVVLTPLPEPDNPEVTELFDASGEEVIARLFTEDRVEIPVARMPRHLLDAIVAIEDDRFYQHRGLDPIGIGRALYRNLRAGRVLEGGSTLTMQLARNLSVGGTRLGQEVTLARKLKEALLTIKLEYKYSKEQILGLYWNSIYLGRGAYGLERAAQTYFRKSIKDVPDDQPLPLTLAESATLAALPQAPEYYSTYTPRARAALRERRDVVLAKMAEQGYITAAEATDAQRAELVLLPPSPAAKDAPYFVDYVIHELKEQFPAVAGNLYQGGYRIITTMDRAIQDAAVEAVSTGVGNLPETGGEKPQAALVAMEPDTGYIRAIVGGRDSTLERNRVLEPRQPGSTFKPFVYAAALATRDYVVTSTQVDTPRTYPGAAPGETWEVRNWEGKSSNAPETMRSALKHSLNTVTVAWMDVLKPKPVIDMARAVGLEAEYPENLTIGLGSVAVSPLQVTAAFASLANGGQRVTPMAVLRVEDRDGSTIAAQQPSRSPVTDPGVAFLVTELLKDVLRPGGTGDKGGALLGGRPASGKSGTTDNSVDAWFVGFTPSLVTSVWAGYDDRRPTALLGGQDISPIWGRFMNRALAGKPYRDWSPPQGVEVAEVCAITGFRANASCPAIREWYLEGTAPSQVDTTVHWHEVVPQLPGVPWMPPGTLPSAPGPAESPGESEPSPSPVDEPAIRAPDAPPEAELPAPPEPDEPVSADPTPLRFYPALPAGGRSRLPSDDQQ